ncbi:MAG TPA: zinc finger HIT domain-containing protein [Candidatus Nanoarchaeia archaeon]|nr:zinc finger HIT domain-containing protein [Candidatus Nanoarchaeia archaeon]
MEPMCWVCKMSFASYTCSRCKKPTCGAHLNDVTKICTNCVAPGRR